MSIGGRLRDERLRLGYSQKQFAAIGNASCRAYSAWENGTVSPKSTFLEAVAQIGVDINYVITGRQTVHDDIDSVLLEELDDTMDALVAELVSTEEDFTPKFIAMDADGSVNMYDRHPLISGAEWVCPVNGQYDECCYTVHSPRLRALWKQSVTVVNWLEPQPPEDIPK